MNLAEGDLMNTIKIIYDVNKKGTNKISTVETHSGSFLAFIQTAHSQIRNYLKALRAGFDI